MNFMFNYNFIILNILVLLYKLNMSKNILNICQALNRDIPLIIENLKNFKRFYQDNLKLHIICPENR